MNQRATSSKWADHVNPTLFSGRLYIKRPCVLRSTMPRTQAEQANEPTKFRPHKWMGGWQSFPLFFLYLFYKGVGGCHSIHLHIQRECGGVWWMDGGMDGGHSIHPQRGHPHEESSKSNRICLKILRGHERGQGERRGGERRARMGSKSYVVRRKSEFWIWR